MAPCVIVHSQYTLKASGRNRGNPGWAPGILPREGRKGDMHIPQCIQQGLMNQERPLHQEPHRAGPEAAPFGVFTREAARSFHEYR